jgi:HK97 gp10 family phage protein
MGVKWRNWRPEKVREAVLDDLVENGEIVGKFVETEARRRLHAITDPAWGEKYRQLIVGRRLMYEISRRAKEVTIRVGVRKGEKGRWYGFYIEMGTHRRPAHPYLRPAVFQNRREIVALLGGR